MGGGGKYSILFLRETFILFNNYSLSFCWCKLIRGPEVHRTYSAVPYKNPRFHIKIRVSVDLPRDKSGLSAATGEAAVLSASKATVRLSSRSSKKEIIKCDLNLLSHNVFWSHLHQSLYFMSSSIFFSGILLFLFASPQWRTETIFLNFYGDQESIPESIPRHCVLAFFRRLNCTAYPPPPLWLIFFNNIGGHTAL